MTVNGLRSDGVNSAQQGTSLLETWNTQLEGTSKEGESNPVTKVVNLLTEMNQRLQKEMKEDQDLYDGLACWCGTGRNDKKASISTSKEEIDNLQSNLESFTGKSMELKTRIKQLDEDVVVGKQALAEATELRKKQLQEFHDEETSTIQSIELLKGALIVLSKHHGASFFAQLTPAASFLQTSENDPGWEMRLENTMDTVMLDNGYNPFSHTPDQVTKGFLETHNVAVSKSVDHTISVSDDVGVVRRAITSAKAFVQAHHEEALPSSYTSRSGGIFGVLKQLKEDMEADLSAAQKTELMQAASFAELHAAKKSEIEETENMVEQKDDELATTDNSLAEAKQDRKAEKAALSAAEQFLMNLEKLCDEGDANFQERKKTRLEEIEAVSETIGILTADEARDAAMGTFSFIQLSDGQNGKRKAAASILRQAAASTGSPLLAALASRVELNAFKRVKKAIDGMIEKLKMQQGDEVKKHDWCISSLHENEVTVARTEAHRDDLSAQIDSHGQKVVSLEKALLAGKAAIDDLQVSLQRASEDRRDENREFQATVADQVATVQVLHVALKRLAEFYHKPLPSFLQTKHQQTPPPQAKYKPNDSATGVMLLIQQLVGEAKILVAQSKKGESDAQLAYEGLVGDTNTGVKALQNEVTINAKFLAKTKKAKLVAQGDLMDTVDELEGLHKEVSSLHTECDYLLKNFDVRQASRAQEIDALGAAKSVLSGANFN